MNKNYGIKKVFVNIYKKAKYIKVIRQQIVIIYTWG